MSKLVYRKMHGPNKKQSCTSALPSVVMHGHCQIVDIKGVLSNNSETAGKMLHDHGSCNIPEFVSGSKAAEMLGCVPSTVTRQCQSGKYPGAKKVPVDGVEVWQIPVGSLPEHAQSMMREEVAATLRERLAAQGLPIPGANESRLSPAEYSIAWENYERSGGTHKRRAMAAQEALLTFYRLRGEGFSVGDAERQVASLHGVSKPTLWRYRQATEGHPQMHWLPLLSPRYKGGRPHVEFTEAAYEFILGRSLNSSETPLSVIFQDARIQAKANGWVIPSDDTIRYRLNKEPAWLAVVGRKGEKALERSYPAIKRDYTSLKLHELWESDGRKVDVFCRWPDGTVARPFVIVWREVRTRLVLSAKGFIQPHAAGVLAAFGQALERAGTAPDNGKIDNGPEYAAKSVTGGQKERYRFLVVPGEQIGVMTMVGTKVMWSKPARGQDKPIESFWRFIADRCDKAPEFEGAYCGRNSVSKPENFRKDNAIPIALYGKKFAEVLDSFNKDHRHTGSGMDGRTAYEVYQELAAQTKRAPVDPAHIRLCKMGSAVIKPAKVDASYTLTIPGYGLCRYWSKKIAQLPAEVLSRKHAVYYDLENPSAPVSVYDGEHWLDDAPLFEELPFLHSGEGAAEHVKKKNDYMKPKKQALKQIKASANKDQLPTLPAVTGVAQLPNVTGEVTFSKQQKALPATGAKTARSAWALSDADRAALEEMKRQQEEKRRKANPHIYQHTGT